MWLQLQHAQMTLLVRHIVLQGVLCVASGAVGQVLLRALLSRHNSNQLCVRLWAPCRYIEELIDKEIASGIPSERVVVAGFSQGGAVAMLALRSVHKLAAVVGERARPSSQGCCVHQTESPDCRRLNLVRKYCY